MCRMRPIVTHWQIVMVLVLVCRTSQQVVDWTSLPAVRAGQINSIVSLTTSSDVSTDITDQTAVFYNSITGAAETDLQYGLSLSSYESWMTDTFSFNITLVSLSITNITVRFEVLNNTFFTKAKSQYIVVWRNDTASKNLAFSTSTPSLPPTIYNNIQVLYGCYLTPSLLVGNLTQQVGGNLTSAIMGHNYSTLVVVTMIAGMQLSNSVGMNDYVDVQTFLSSTKKVVYNVTIQNNNLLTQICLTTVIYDPYVSSYYLKTIIEFQSMSLNATNRGLADIPYTARYDGNSRLFFGISRFNLSMSNTRYLNVQTSNFSLISLLYDRNNAMNEVIINMLFFAVRTCHVLTQFYYPSNYSCQALPCPSNSRSSGSGTADYLLCQLCHYSCLSCTAVQSSTSCSTCNATAFRNKTGTTCPCMTNYTDIGSTLCVLCNSTIVGCINCSSPTNCTQCNTPTYLLNTTTRKCDCSNSYFPVTGYCLKDPGCLLAKMFNNQVVCATCDSSLNFIRDNDNVSCICNLGYFPNHTTNPYSCSDRCNDSIAAVGHCDDGNNMPGDGCDENCNVERGFHCKTNYVNGNPGKSTCVLITSVTATYLFAQRIINTHQFKVAFSLNPIPPNLNQVSFNSSNFVTTLPVQNQIVSCDPSTGIVYISADYLESIEGTLQNLSISFLNSTYFIAEDTVTTFNITGINAQLVLQEKCSYNSILQDVVLCQGALAIALAVFSSIVGLKLAGIELFIPIQTIYFSLSTLGSRSSYVSTLNNLKYVNGFSEIVSYDYLRTYSQHSKLVGIQYQTQFLLSTNMMIGIFLVTLVWIFAHHFILKYKQYKLQSFLSQIALIQSEIPRKLNRLNLSDSSDDKEDQEVDQQRKKLRRGPKNAQNLLKQNQLRQDHHYSLKIFSFEMDRFYFIFYLILVNPMFFAFNIMGRNLPISVYHYSQDLSIIICIMTLFFLLGNVIFFYNDQKINKMISFTCINDRYAYIYLSINAVVITIISFTFQQSFSIYLTTAASSLYIFLIIIERPYCSNLLELENIIALYLHIMLVSNLALICVLQNSSLTEDFSFIVTLIIAGLILLGEILSIIRIVVKVNFKKTFDEVKNPYDRNDQDNQKRKVIEKNLDILFNDLAQIIPSDSIRNGLFTPKQRMIDWQTRNIEEYQTLRKKESFKDELKQEEPQENQSEHQDDGKLNQLDILKKKLRNNLKLKKQREMKKTD